ncbi:hypothetical protein ACLHDG_08975 [Sulfurovum sp. CS9]|uniref:hypothetical protein n=1 Tax=Sulfurovum sp. CS9 TaxID=3391146 RepID=UPI0039EAA228
MQNYRLFLKGLESPEVELTDRDVEVIADRVDKIIREKYSDGEVSKGVVKRETYDLVKARKIKKKFDSMRSKIPKKLYNNTLTDANLPALYFTVVNAKYASGFIATKGSSLFADRPDRLYDAAKRGLALAIESCRQLGENEEALKLLEQVTISKTSKNWFYNEWEAAFRKILMDAHFSGNAIKKTIMPELKRISKDSKPTPPM